MENSEKLNNINEYKNILYILYYSNIGLIILLTTIFFIFPSTILMILNILLSFSVFCLFCHIQKIRSYWSELVDNDLRIYFRKKEIDKHNSEKYGDDYKNL